MRNLVSTYVDQFRQDRQKQLKLAAVLAALALIVAGVVFWQLHNTGVAMTNEVFCGQEEHVHDDGCYEQVLTCDNEEADHVHEDSCFETVLTCQIPEHTHTIECMTDDTADVETANVWEATLPALSGNWSQDVAAIAESQLGYTESTANFVLADDGETHMGYTRYGAWYGNEYGDWDAMFASFCLNYANIPASVVAENSGAYALAVSLNEQGLYIDAAGFTPAAGDLVFFDENGNGQADRVGIIVGVGDNKLDVIEGNSEDAVAENTYYINDSGILAFGILPDQGTPEGIETADGDILYVADDGGVSVSVTAPAGALPENAELSVILLDEDSEDYAVAVQAVNADIETLSAGTADRNVAVLDISFLADGAEVEPAEAVTVSIDASGLVPEDAGSITIRHLEETGAGIVPVIVAEVDASSPYARFEVESFSKFDIEWNDGTGTSITVHVYNMNGTGIEEVLDTEYTHSGGDIVIADIVDHLQQNNEYVATYTFQYATIYYETASQGNQLTATTLGSESNSVVEISKNGTTYTVRLVDGTTTTISNPDTIDIHMYYSLPTIEISASSGEHTDTVGLTTTNTYFQGLDASDSSVTYTWVLSDDSLASVMDTGNGTATFTWNTDNASAGDTVDVIVTMTNTYKDEEGNTVTEQASDTYTLTYGEVAVTISVSNIPTYSSGQGGGQGGTTTSYGVAYVAIVDENGNTVTTAEINNSSSTSGTVTVWVAPGTYTVGVTGICGDSTAATTTVRSSGEATLTVGDNGGSASVTLGDTVTSGSSTGGVNGSNNETGTWGSSVYYYEHIDVKIAVAELEGMNETFSDLDSVYVFDKYGNLIFSSNDLIYNADTDDYNCLFDVGNASDIHSLAVSSEDTIVITYEVIDNDTGETKTYTAVISASSTYAEGEYYQNDDINAYQLYNCIYGTSISETEWATALANGTLGTLLGNNYDPNGISLAGLSYIQVADYLCDTRTDNSGRNAGLDFVIDVSALEVTNIDLRVAKNYTGVPDTETIDENTVFKFDLIELDSKYITTGTMTWYTTDGTDDTDAWLLDYSTGSTGSWQSTAANVWSSIVSFDRTFEYESESGTNFYYYILRETSYVNAVPVVQYYGIIVNVSFEGALPEISVSYAEMTCTNPYEGVYGTYEIISGTYRQLNLTYVRDGEGNITESYYALPFGNAYDAGIKIEKRAMTSTGESGDIVDAQFTLTRTREVVDEETEEPEIYFEYYQPAETEDDEAEWVRYYVEDGEPLDGDGNPVVFPNVTIGSVNLGILDDGDYTLTETVAPDGYYPLEESITFTITNGVISQAAYGGSNDSKYISVSEDKLTLTVNNESSAVLPSAGGIGTWIYTVIGLLLIGGVASLLVYRKRRAV